MIHEFAIDPTAMTNFDRVARFMEACGPGMPRLIAHLPTDWLRLAVRSCAAAGLQVMALKRVEILIETAIKRGRFLNRGRTFDGCKTWIESAASEHRRLRFRAVVASAMPDLNQERLNIDEDLSTDRLWNPPRSLTIDRSTRGLIEALAPMLRLARRVVLIEPHFDIGARNFVNPIRALLHQAASEPPQLEEVALHVTSRRDRMRDYLENNHLSDFEQLVPTGVRAMVFVWQGDIIPGGPNARDVLHDRFLLTDRGGVQVGWGFDTRRGSQTTISLLDDATCRELEDNVSPESRRFKSACSTPLIFTGRAR